jgi:maltooligosyltrehalose trehalohydrolase
MPGGAEIIEDAVHFRIWAPDAEDVSVAIETPVRRWVRLESEGNGYFSGWAVESTPDALYTCWLDDRGPYPDPYSRFQPSGPHGPSMFVDPDEYRWNDPDWTGLHNRNLVIYEMHVGAFTPEGTLDAAARELPELADLGITCVELMPLGEFPGRFNWGYDAVDLFAPYHGYGDHDALKQFVDAAHACGIGVLLDVVYNHVGADGNYLSAFCADYFTDRYTNAWGDSFNFDGPRSAAVREFVIENAKYWIREFHLDGLRLDATQDVRDQTAPHVLAELAEQVRRVASPRSIVLIGENEPQDSTLLNATGSGGFGLDALWNDDFHHSCRVALTGSRGGYFHDYRGQAQELVSLCKHGFLYQGQHYYWQDKPRGRPALRRPACSFVACIQNHDQIANTLCGVRLQYLTSSGRLRAMTALLLLAPPTPFLFMGQEFCASAPFAFFADSATDLAQATWLGRREFLSQFTQFATREAQTRVPDPCDPLTFERAKLNFWERKAHSSIYDMHRELLRLRRFDPVIGDHSSQFFDGAVLGEKCLLLRWCEARSNDRLLLVNLADELGLHGEIAATG